MRHHGTLRTIVVLAVLLSALGSALGADAQPPRAQKAELELLADRTAYEPGSTGRLAARVVIEEGWHTNSHEPTFEWLIPTDLTLILPEGWETPEIVYPQGAMKRFAFTEEPISVYEDEIAIVATFAVPAEATGPAPVSAKLRYQACDDRSCLPPVTTEASLELTLGDGGQPTHGAVFGEESAASGPIKSQSFPLLLLLAVLGGLILNAMPCVLPVLSIKIFGLIRSAGQGRSQVVVGSLATTAGILASFLALAGAAVAARAAGAAVGWGTQFQHPGFVTFLAIVVVLFCLNLWGLFEIPLPQGLARVASSGPSEGIAGHFASGLFATLMATPCSAPFLGTAVGFALSQPASVILATFLAIGLGMAIPYLILAAAPGAARVFPQPGPWMDHVRKVMGFLLAGAAVWLLYVLAAQISAERLAAIELGLLVLALFVWMRSRAARGVLVKRTAVAGIAAAIVATLWLASGWAGVGGAALAGNAPDHRGGLIEWTPFDRQEALALARQGRLVFVDVTADWCLTCKANERLVLETEEVAEAFEQHEVVPMKADWTNRDDAIGDLLAEFGKAGIPFYVLYRPQADPHVFGELLTKERLISALRESRPETVAELDD